MGLRGQKKGKGGQHLGAESQDLAQGGQNMCLRGHNMGLAGQNIDLRGHSLQYNMNVINTYFDPVRLLGQHHDSLQPTLPGD